MPPFGVFSEELRRTRCFVCGDVVEGSSRHGIRLHFCCQRCYTRHPDEIFAADALKQYGCTSQDLKPLEWRDPSALPSFALRLYIRAEVEYLGHLRRGKEQWEGYQKRKALQQTVMKKRIRLENSTGMRLAQVRHDLRPVVFGDYFTARRTGRILQKTVLTRLRAHERATQIVDQCRTDPLTALDFCVEYPDWGVAEFLDLRRRVQLVFRLEGRRILHKVPPAERTKLEKTPLADIYAQFEKVDSAGLVKYYVQNAVGLDTARQIWSHDAFAQALQRGGEEEAIATKLVAFWLERDNTKTRQSRLDAALKHYQLTLPTTSKYYQEYITGSGYRDLDEILAIAAFGQKLESRGVPPWGLYFSLTLQRLMTMMYHEGVDWREAVSFIVHRVPKRLSQT